LIARKKNWILEEVEDEGRQFIDFALPQKNCRYIREGKRGVGGNA
jgi:hypothetical protein